MKNVLLAFLALVGVIALYYVTLQPSNSLRLLNPKRLTPAPTQITHNQTVLLTPQGFIPASLSVKAGDTVIWKNTSGKDATIVLDQHPTPMVSLTNPGTIANSAQASLKFDKAGTYHFHNASNLLEKETIEVK